MLAIDKFLNGNIQKPDVIFVSSKGVGSDIFYIPESGNLTNFFSNQKLNNLSRLDSVIIPPRIVLGGKSIINNTYYLSIKKELKGFPFFKVPPKLKSFQKMRLIDLSPIIGKMVNISNQKTINTVYKETFEKIFSLNNDFLKGIKDPESKEAKLLKERSNIVLIDIDLNAPRTGFTENLIQYLKMNTYNIDLNIDPRLLPNELIYKIGPNYYPVGSKVIRETKDGEKASGYIKINRMMFQRVINILEELLINPDTDLTKPIEKKNQVRVLGFKEPKDLDSLLKVGEDIKDIMDKVSGKGSNPIELAKETKDYIEGNPLFNDLEGKNFKEKLSNLNLAIKHAEKLQSKRFDDMKNMLDNGQVQELEQEEKDELKLDTKVEEKISTLDSAHKELLKKHNGTLFLEDMQERSVFGERSYNPDNIVGLKEFNGYDKQAQEFYNNLEQSVEDLLRTFEKDPDLGITIHKIESKLKDDNKTRYKEFSAQISHPNFGQTFSKKYTVRFKVPYPVEGKYLKIGGNDYVMVNQLFNKPVQKVNAHLARLYTHYNTTSISLKNSKINNKYGLSEIEKETIVSFKNLENNKKLKIKVETEPMSPEIKDTMDFIEPKIRNLFQYSVLNVSGPDYKFHIDLSHLGEDENPIFYTYRAISKDKKEITEAESTPVLQVFESAKINRDKKEIEYKVGSDLRTFPLEHIDEFILGLYNKISTNLIGTDIIKKSKTSQPYFSARIIGKNLPVAVLLINELGFQKAMTKMELKWSLNDKKALTQEEAGSGSLGGQPINIPCMSSGKRVYITVYPKSLKQRHLALGLLKYKIKDVEFNATANDLYFGALAKEMGEVGLVKLKEAIPKIIDPITEKILREYGYPTDVLTLYSETMPNLLLDRGESHFEDLDYYRIRMSEAISHIGYKQIQTAISELKKKKNFKDEKIFLKPEFIMSSLLGAGIFQNAKTINPIEEVMLSQKVVKTGIGNVRKDQVTLARRDLNRSYFGTISPTATNEYGGIGSNQTLTNGTTITDRFGSIKSKEWSNKDNPFNMLSPVESLTPFFEYDDTTRRIMGNQQTGQFTQLENPDEPLVQTGFESYFPWLVSERFTKKAKINGRVSIKDNVMTIVGTGKDLGKEQKIPLRASKSRTKRGVYLLNKYKTLINDGQNVKAGSILASTSSLASGKLSIGKNLVIAEMGYNGLNYEDGWVISKSLSKKYKNTYLQKITIMVPEDVKITSVNMSLNQDTKSGDKLFSFIKKDYYNRMIDADDETDDTDDTLYGLEQHGQQSNYYSPGGKINEIVVKLNSNKVDPKLKSLWNQSISDLEKLQKECRILSEKDKNLSQQEKEEIYMNCMGNTDNISSLTVGGHKINGEEPGWAIIEVYIERDNPINNGSKFTLGNSGGKGTVQYVIPEGSEPITAETNLKVDFIPTSLSIIKRKNPSIYFNMYLGKCFYFINEIAKGLDEAKLKKFVLGAYQIIDKTEDKRIIKEIETFFQQPSNIIRKALNKSDSLNRPLFAAIVPPFMNKLTMRDIKQLANYIGIPLKEKILIPENDGSYTLKKVPVGILNVFLLEHFPSSQGSVRGSQYVKNSLLTNQGSSGTKDRKGATKTGLYDLYSLLTKTPYNLIKELHSLKSDARGAKYYYQKQLLMADDLPSIKDIQISKDDTPTKNYVESLLLGAGLKAYY